MIASGHDDSSRSPASPSARAHRHLPAVLVFVIAAVVGLAADLVSKHWTFQSLLADREAISANVQAIQRKYEQMGVSPPAARRVLQDLHVSRSVAPGVKLTLSTNPGVVFGLPMHRGLVLAATAIVLVVVTWFFITSGAKQYWLHAALGMVLAGALGNQYDRLFSIVRLPGVDPIRYEVRDFIDCSGLYYPWVYNIADVLLVIGVAIILAHGLFGRKDAPRQRTR
ncbi:MAG: signal peptidase II [Planctomycetota bacterium]